MIILRGKNFSEKKKSEKKLDMRDEDHIKDLEEGRVKKRHVAGLTAAGSLLGAGVGSAVGEVIGEAVKNTGKASKIGTGVGMVAAGTASYLGSRKLRKKANKELDDRIDHYKNSSESERKYLRERYNEERRRKEHKKMIAAAMAPKAVFSI